MSAVRSPHGLPSPQMTPGVPGDTWHGTGLMRLPLHQLCAWLCCRLGRQDGARPKGAGLAVILTPAPEAKAAKGTWGRGCSALWDTQENVAQVLREHTGSCVW